MPEQEKVSFATNFIVSIPRTRYKFDAATNWVYRLSRKGDVHKRDRVQKLQFMLLTCFWKHSQAP